MQYVPMPNMMMMAGAADSNNYLDVRTETHFQNQGTVRVDHIFSNDDTLFGRYSIGTENGFSPSSGVTATTENLPGFGANFDNRSQQAVISWSHLFAPNKVNTGSFAVSRLSMDRTSQNDGVNDIVGALGIQGVGFGGPGAWGAPWFAAQGYTASETRSPPHPCTPGTQCTSSGTLTRGSGDATESSSAATIIGIRGPCGDFSRTAATTNTPTGTRPTSDSTTGPAPGLPVCC